MSSINGMWQINIICDTMNGPILVVVPENCYTKELFDAFKQHPKAPVVSEFELISIGGTIRGTLPCNMTQRLSEFSVGHLSTLTMIARLPGGVWPTIEEIRSQRRQLKPAEGFTITTSRDQHPDVVSTEQEGERAVMKCGHAIAPQTLVEYCYFELEEGKHEIRCPVHQCNVKWKFAIIRRAACLTPNEFSAFETRAQLNYLRSNPLEMKECPKCGIFSRPANGTDKRLQCTNCTSRAGKGVEFCWTCLQPWKTSGVTCCGNPDCGVNKTLFDILANCTMKDIDDELCPSKRACPKCATIIEHIDCCKHMTCAYCRYEFCFICLERFPCQRGRNYDCIMAPRQNPKTKFIGDDADSP